MNSSSAVKHEASREVNQVAGAVAAASVHVLSGVVSPMYSSSTVNIEAHGEAEWVASPTPSLHVSASAVSPSTSRHEGVEGTLTHKNVTFIFVIAVVLSLAIFIATYCIAYIIWCMMLRPRERNPHDYAYRSRVAAAAAAAVTMESAERSIAYGGLEAALVSSFPVLKYRASEEVKGAANLQRNEECAVCLSEFEAGEEMKVLPVCRHGFHKACIDRWLLSHMTCPICRISLFKRTQGGHGNNSR